MLSSFCTCRDLYSVTSSSAQCPKNALECVSFTLSIKALEILVLSFIFDSRAFDSATTLICSPISYIASIFWYASAKIASVNISGFRIPYTLLMLSLSMRIEPIICFSVSIICTHSNLISVHIYHNIKIFAI